MNVTCAFFWIYYFVVLSLFQLPVIFIESTSSVIWCIVYLHTASLFISYGIFHGLWLNKYWWTIKGWISVTYLWIIRDTVVVRVVIVIEIVLLMAEVCVLDRFWMANCGSNILEVYKFETNIYRETRDDKAEDRKKFRNF